MKPIMETVTREEQVTGVIADMINFVRYLDGVYDFAKLDTEFADVINKDDVMVQLARAFWDQQHGE